VGALPPRLLAVAPQNRADRVTRMQCQELCFQYVLYSAPQLHRTIVAIVGICARNRPFSRAVSFSASIRVAALFPDARRIAIGSERPFLLCNAVGKLGSRARFGTFLQTCERVHKVLGDGHWHLLAESPIDLKSMRPRFCSRSEKIPACAEFVQAGLIIHAVKSLRATNAPCRHSVFVLRGGRWRRRSR